MRGVTPAEKQEALKAFVESPTPPLFVADRSTLERWASCPWQAKAIQDGRCKTVGILAEAGEAGHHAMSSVTREWIDSNGAMSVSDLKQDLEFELRRARPDLQPEAIKAVMPAAWNWAKFIYSIHPGNILAFDGGEEAGRSGQLAVDFADLGVRVTSELDLLYANESSVEVLEEVDYKTGWKVHEIDDIAASFQFQLHSVLVFDKYPDVNALRLRVWDTRCNHMTYAVTFPRHRLHDYTVRVRSAIETMREHQDNPPTWPTTEKCGICPAAAICPVADESLADLARDPAAFVGKLVAVEARADAMRELAAKHVDATGQDIQSGGVYFGRNKPKAERKAAATIYSLKEKA